MSFQLNIRLVGVSVVIAVLLLVGYLLYDKNSLLSGFIIFFGLILAFTFVISEIYFKNKEFSYRY
jgi:uncharacterized paraquat-inducible protein A